MKRALLVLLIAGVVVAVLVSVIGSVAVASVDERAPQRAWAAGLGSVESLPVRFPKRDASEAATKLIDLAIPLGIDFTPRSGPNPSPSTPPVLKEFGTWLKTEQESADRNLSEVPPDVDSFLGTRVGPLDAVRDHLLRGGEVVWPVDVEANATQPFPNLLAHMHLSRILVVRGLATRSWPDLEAAWRLSRSLQERPELISQLIALAIARNVNAAAWKLPAPAPAFLYEMGQVDHVYLLAQGMQSETFYMWRHGVKDVDSFPNPFLEWSAADYIAHERTTVEHFLEMRQCGFDAVRYSNQRVEAIAFWNVFAKVATPNLASIWPRAFRYRAEHEAKMNALRAAAGRPIVPRSQCIDGSWKLENGTLAFSKALPKASEQDAAMPLTLHVR